MKLGKAFLWGLPIVIFFGILKWLGDTFLEIWHPFLEKYFENPTLEWIAGFVLTIIVVIFIGYAIRITAPIRKIAKKNKIMKMLQGKSHPVVLTRYAGDWVLGLVTEYEEESKIYEILLLSVPIPVTGQIIFVPEKDVILTKLTTTDLMNQLTSLGFRPILESLRKDFLKHQGHSES